MTDIPIAVLDQLVRQQEEIAKLKSENERLQQQVAWLLDQVRKLKNDNV